MNRRDAIGLAAPALFMAACLLGMAPAPAASFAARFTPRAIYAGVMAGHVYRSADGIAKWEESDTGLPADSAITALAVTADGNSIYAAAWGSGVYVSTDGGMH